MPTLAAAPLSAIVLAACAAIALTGCAVSLDLADDVTEPTEHDTIDLDGIGATTATGRVAIGAGGTDTIEPATVRETIEGDAEHQPRRRHPSNRG